MSHQAPTQRMNHRSKADTKILSTVPQFKNILRIWSVREAKPKQRGSRRCTLDVIFVVFGSIPLQRSDSTFQQRICPIFELKINWVW